ncbi:MAG: hypothetical protein P9M14_09015 [Candidatus Alcyoniella australis]|nr:hypothetical protein [Candidatus Alcyoniella australis]
MLAAKHRVVLLIVAGLLLLTCFASAQEQSAYLQIELEINKDVLPTKIWGTNYPSYAVWVVDAADGRAITIYVSKKLGYDKWFGTKSRPSAAPVWEAVRANEPGYNPDAVSSATPKNLQTITWPIPNELMNKELSVFIEANCSFQYNDFYSKDAKEGQPGYCEFNGQPSVIWKATFTPADAQSTELTPTLIGHGHVLGLDHKIDPDLSNLTSAKQIFSKIEIRYLRP